MTQNVSEHELDYLQEKLTLSWKKRERRLRNLKRQKALLRWIRSLSIPKYKYRVEKEKDHDEVSVSTVA